MPHLKRAVALLSLVLVFMFVVPRVMPTPAFLIDFGFHTRNAEQNAEKWASVPASYVSTSVCVDCHKDKYTLWQKGNHRVVSCENCHGPAAAHITTGSPEALNTSRDLCGLCHARLVSRPSGFPQVNMNIMGGDAECVTCHDPHEPRAGMPPQVPHTMEGRANCQTCHNPQAHEPFEQVPPQAPHSMEGRSDCLSCHGSSEFRGASLPHVPAGLGGTNCLLCHTTGGVKPLPDDHTGRTSATCLNCHRLN